MKGVEQRSFVVERPEPRQRHRGEERGEELQDKRGGEEQEARTAAAADIAHRGWDHRAVDIEVRGLVREAGARVCKRVTPPSQTPDLVTKYNSSRTLCRKVTPKEYLSKARSSDSAAQPVPSTIAGRADGS